MFESRRDRSLIESQWPGALVCLACALKAGLSLEQALDALIDDGPEPLRSHVRSKDGGNAALPTALDLRVNRIFEGPSLRLARAALLLSHQAGGQAGRLLELSAQLLQQKIEMKERVKALSAQSTVSAWVVGLSPFGILALLAVFSPDYVDPLFSTRAGWLVLGAAAVLIAAGLLLVRWMAEIDS